MTTQRQLVRSRVWSGNRVIARVELADDGSEAPYDTVCEHPVRAREVHVRFADAKTAEEAAEKLAGLYEDARAAIEGAAKPFDDAVTKYQETA